MRPSRSFLSIMPVLLASVAGLALASQAAVAQTDTNSIVLMPSVAAADAPAAPVQKKRGSPVDYAAESVRYDQREKLLHLVGKVELKQDGRTIEADRVTYNAKDDVATAEGNVVITDANGDVHRADMVELSDRMRQGLIEKLSTTMADGSRAWATQGIKESEQRYKLKNAAYTACKPCEEDPTRRPPWQLHAKEVNMLRDEQRIEYRHAWLDVGGVPVLYTPYFSHPDGTVEQKSGFLTPSFGWNSELGGFYSQPYYWAISPSTDATFTLMPTTKEGPLLRGQFRKRFETAYLETDGSITHSGRTDSVGNVAVAQDEETRGHFFAKGNWDISDHWRGGADLKLSSDEQYLRQYGFSEDNILENILYAERFEGRDYAIVKGLAFQDLRAGSAKSDQPNILPYAAISLLGDPNATLGGRWGFDASALSLARDGNGQDVWRLASRANWQRQDISSLGLVFDSEVAAMADTYYTDNRVEAATNPAEPDSKKETRFMPSAQLTGSYPMKSDFRDFQLRVAPVSTIYLAPNIDNGSDVPNEDSQDVQLDVGNILEGSRFPGLDRIEDKSHVAYGLQSGLYTYEGGYIDTFVGQSYNFYEDGNPFPNGSGLESRSSDYVGAVNASLDEGRHDLSYRFQVDSDSLGSQRHELYGKTTMGRVQVDGNYMYAKGVAGTTYAESREQLALGSTVDLSDMWTLRGDTIYDLSEADDEKGLRRAVATLTYTHDCYDVAVTADRNLADDSSGVQDTTVMFRIGLKNLGEYSTKAFTLSQTGGSDSED